MKNLLSFYNSEEKQLKNKLLKVKKNLKILSLLRLTVFILTVVSIYLLFENTLITTVILIVGGSSFYFLVVKYSNEKLEKNLLNCKIEINQTEIAVLNGDFSFLPKGNEYLDSDHHFSHDIDLFGENSFFQYLNRTASSEGCRKLAKLMTENQTSSIYQKQEAIKELSEKVKWRQHFSALISMVKTEIPTKKIIGFFKNYKNVFSKIALFLPISFSIISILFIVLTFFEILPFNALVIWFFVGLIVTSLFLKKTQRLYTNASKAKDTFRQYYLVLQEIENTNFSSEILKEKQKEIQSENKKASSIFNEFSKALDAFDQRNNLLIASFGNAFFLWEIKCAIKVEKWITLYSHTIKQSLEVITFFDAKNSLANFCFNHPNYVFPEIVKDSSIINSQKLGHPLLNSKNRIDNDFEINKNSFLIVTGANMAGKSTFLRTISLSIVMANIGLPVCANSFKYKPVKLITSMRTSDSLAENESYFYSELKRLKLIVETIQTDDYFIVLDEILKGTNSKDKASGSKKFVEKLVTLNTTGIIATHDVSLCELENDFKEIKNFFFDAKISNNELSFDYLFKKGVCENRNASFLLKKMKII
ncbi:MAG: DNA mismatch repair protein MutS [Crocinitomicaceae bacterium]|nr:DNA mismatch repair protein MutS [Crocinitomicaceae bacterium]